MKRTPWLSKPIIDPVNTAVWFTMDALWLLEATWPAYVFAALTVATGLWLVKLGRGESPSTLFADLAMMCWIVMNTVWMAYDLNDGKTPVEFAASISTLGAFFMVLAAWNSQDIRRVRLMKRSGPADAPPTTQH